MKASSSARSTLAVTLLVGVTACSVTDYQQPIDRFAAASRSAETGLSALSSDVTDAYTALLREKAVAGDALVEVAPGDCLFNSTSCRLDVVTRDGITQPLAPPPALANTLSLMASITAYADNLVALVSADTAAAVAANVNTTLGSLESLAATIEQAGGAKRPLDLSGYETPVGNALRWITGQYVAFVKLDGLRRATADAQPVIAEATRVMEIAADTAAIVPRGTLAEILRERLTVFQANRSQANLDQLIQSADQFNHFLQAKPPDVFAKMNAAHQALTYHLQHTDVTFPEVISKIEIFAAAAEQLVKIAQSLAAADR